MSIQSNFPAIKPTLLLDFANTEQLDPRITFTRASTGTYYDGKTVAKAEENLFLRSQEFENASWAKARTTVTANAIAAPDGTTSSDAIYETVDTNTHYINQAITPNGQAYTISVFAKSGLGRDWLWIRTIASGPAERTAFFDITNGVVGNVGAGLTASITSVGGGWYRCIVTTTNSATTQDAWGFGPSSANGTNNYTGDITKGIYVWGAQLEQRSSVTAYTATTTQPITNYVPVLLTAASGVARFEHNPTTGESLGLEIEESRTNLLTYSEQFDNANWFKTACTITANAIVAPDGTLTADKTVEDTTSNVRYVQSPLTNFTSGVAYTLSCYFKAAERSIVSLYFETAAFPNSGRTAWFNLATQAVQTESGVTATITDVGNGWRRCSVTATADATASARPSIAVVTSMGAFTNYTGDGYSGIYIWGAQLEAGAFATSYIPTVASQVTRAADAASMTGTNFSSWYAADQGTLYAEAQYPNPAVTGKTHEWVSLFETSSGINLYEIRAFSSTVRFAVQGTNTVIGTGLINLPNKAAFGFTASGSVSQVGSLNGAATASASTAITRSANALSIGAGGSSNALSGTIKKIAYYPARVSNAQLQALTS